MNDKEKIDFNFLLKRNKELEDENDQLKKLLDREPNTLYTYYRIDLENITEEWDYQICETLQDVLEQLEYLDIHLDDDTKLPKGKKRKVIITGVPMTPIAFAEYYAKSMGF